MSVTDYLGRQADLLAFHGTTPGKVVALTESLMLNGGYLITGIEKLSQRFLLALLTVVGSKQYEPTEGSQFLLDAQQGYWRTVADVDQSFYSALVDVKRQLQLTDAVDTPDDEKYASAKLNDVMLVWPKATLAVTLTTVAGTSRKFIAPLPVMLK